MKEQKLYDIINIENFINEVTIKLNEKRRFYPYAKFGRQYLKAKDPYFSIKDIETCLNEILKQ